MQYVNHNVIDTIDWFTWPWNRCKARAVSNHIAHVDIRCDRKRYHKGDHVSEAQGEILLWANVWLNAKP